jgi:hypothetical protein
MIVNIIFAHTKMRKRMYRLDDYLGDTECEVFYCTYPALYSVGGNKRLCGFHAAQEVKNNG